MLSTDRQTDELTNATKNITSFAKEVTILEALRERRPPWPRQIITLITPTVKMLNLGCERLLPPPPPLKKKKKKNSSGSLPAPRSGYATTIMVVFCSSTHLTIPRSPPKFKQFFFYYSGSLHKISSQSIHNFLSNVHRQTKRQTNQRYQKHNLLCQGGKITSFAKVVTNQRYQKHNLLGQGGNYANIITTYPCQVQAGAWVC